MPVIRRRQTRQTKPSADTADNNQLAVGRQSRRQTEKKVEEEMEV